MARTEFVGSQSGGDSLPREGVPADGGSRPFDLGAIDARLNQIETQEIDLAETARSTSGEQRSQPVPELADGPRELLSESTDLNELMAAILGEDARDRVAIEEPVAQSRPIEHPDDISDARAPWRLELETLLAEQPLREVAIAPPTPAPPVATGRFNSLMSLSAGVRRWPMSRVSLLLVGALAGMTLGVLAWQSGKSDSAAPSTTSRAIGTAGEQTSAAGPGSGAPPIVTSTDEATGSPATTTGGAAQARSAAPPQVSSARSSNNTRVRDTPAPPAEVREAVTAPSRLVMSSSVPLQPLESAPTPAVARAPEPPPSATEAGRPPQPTATVASSGPISMTTATSTTASPAAPVIAGGAAAGAARLEPPAAALSAAVLRTEPRLLRRALPEYPSNLRKVVGSVTVTMTVDAQGRVVKVRSINGPNLLRPAAEAAAQRWRYEPATLNGTPLESSVNVTFNFDPSGVPQTSR